MVDSPSSRIDRTGPRACGPTLSDGAQAKGVHLHDARRARGEAPGPTALKERGPAAPAARQELESGRSGWSSRESGSTARIWSKVPTSRRPSWVSTYACATIRCCPMSRMAGALPTAQHQRPGTARGRVDEDVDYPRRAVGDDAPGRIGRGPRLDRGAGGRRRDHGPLRGGRRRGGGQGEAAGAAGWPQRSACEPPSRPPGPRAGHRSRPRGWRPVLPGNRPDERAAAGAHDRALGGLLGAPGQQDERRQACSHDSDTPSCEHGIHLPGATRRGAGLSPKVQSTAAPFEGPSCRRAGRGVRPRPPRRSSPGAGAVPRAGSQRRSRRAAIRSSVPGWVAKKPHQDGASCWPSSRRGCAPWTPSATRPA